MSSSPETPGRTGGVNIAGSVGQVRDIVGGNKIEITNVVNRQDPAVLAEMTRIFAGQLNASAEARAQAEARAAELARQLGTPAEAAEQFFRLLGAQNVPLERLPSKLAEVAAQYQETLARLATLNPEDPAAQVLRDR